MPTLPTTPKSVKRDTITVSQLNRQAKHLLEGKFSSVWIEGEISNLAQPSSGHWYFSLKDSGAQVRCAMFRSANARLRFKVEAGQQIIVRAKLSLYEARGDYQLIVEHIEPAGDGALAKAFEQLKQKLQSEGLFETNRKQAIPGLAKHIAVITSATGAAVHDILTVLARRFPLTKITLLPTMVQGNEAASEIARKIKQANQHSKQLGFDVILLGRGGGSLEDLWSFNEEIVARAIAESTLPIVSAVGHEIDFTIADFVADIRAATPSAAAELLSPDQQELSNALSGFEQLLFQQIQRTVNAKLQTLENLQKRLRHPGSKLQEYSQRLDELEQRLIYGLKQQIRHQRHRLELLHADLQKSTPLHLIYQMRSNINNLYRQLEVQVQQLINRQQLQLESNIHLLNAVNPLATLDRGYAIVRDEQQTIVANSSQLTVGDNIHIRLAKGEASAKITATHLSIETTHKNDP
jgi:exodeoxyribonuclease VII large subunit